MVGAQPVRRRLALSLCWRWADRAEHRQDHDRSGDPDQAEARRWSMASPLGVPAEPATGLTEPATKF